MGDVVQSLRLLRLTMLVHLDAIRMAPRSYLRTVYWRLRRLKLRSKNARAALLARSPHAYALWILKREAVLAADHARLADARPQSLDILPIIEDLGNPTALQRTLESLAANRFPGPVLILQFEEASSRLGAVETSFEGRICRNKLEFFAALEQIAPAWVLPMLAGDVLAPTALSTYTQAITDVNVNVDIVYSDDDVLDTFGVRQEPHFKPDWNAELFRFQDYISFACILRSKYVVAALAWTPMAWARNMVEAAITGEKASHPIHLPQILHHRSARELSMSKALPSVPTLATHPPVTIIIPTRNQIELLRTCVEGLERTDYDNFQCIIVDNESDDPETLEYLSGLDGKKYRRLNHPGPFNYSLINNRAVAHASSDFLCFLNNDIEIVDSKWLEALVAQVIRPEAGAVGAKLVYPDHTIQHAGVFVGIGGAAGHAHRFGRDAEPVYFNRPHLPQYVSAVTAACMVVRTERFRAVGGFDENDFPVAFNDVDLCLKLAAKGWINIYEPRAMLIHHESRSRGSDMLKRNKARFSSELAALKRKWHTDVIRDPWHNPNLSRLTEQFVLDLS